MPMPRPSDRCSKRTGEGGRDCKEGTFLVLGKGERVIQPLTAPEVRPFMTFWLRKR
ncbi:hypothetical protein SCYAM73S_05281 [Streptomyces cyaneofuscatus]